MSYTELYLIDCSEFLNLVLLNTFSSPKTMVLLKIRYYEFNDYIMLADHPRGLVILKLVNEGKQKYSFLELHVDNHNYALKENFLLNSFLLLSNNKTVLCMSHNGILY